MGSRLSALKAHFGNRLSRHVLKLPHRWPDDQPMVSFTFDDVPDSAAIVGAPTLEDYHGRGSEM
jgi:hypothetical protein